MFRTPSSKDPFETGEWEMVNGKSEERCRSRLRVSIHDSIYGSPFPILFYSYFLFTESCARPLFPLAQQRDPEPIFDELRELVRTGDFTLGKPVGEFEEMFASMLGLKHAIGVGSGTDACKLPLKALGVGPGDEVITCANTFWATVGAIAEVGARPVFVIATTAFAWTWPARGQSLPVPKPHAGHLTGSRRQRAS
jgi:hypothetical protein